MKRIIKGFCLFVTLVALVAVPVLAIVYTATLQLVEDGTTAYDMYPAQAAADVDFMAANGYIDADGLDTRVGAGTTYIPHMLADDRILFATPVALGGTYNYQFTTENAPLTNFYVITGDEGYFTTADAAGIEPGNDFEIEWDGYFDTDYIFDPRQYLLNKYAALTCYYTADGEITAEIQNVSAASPVVAASNNGFDDTSQTDHVLNLPAGIAAGNVLIAILTLDYGGTSSYTVPTGWTHLYHMQGASGYPDGIAIYKVADGTEGASVTITCSSGTESSYVTLRITGAYGDVEVALDGTGANSAAPDCPSVTASWGIDNNLFIAVEHNDANANVTGNPAGYGGLVNAVGGAAGVSTGVTTKGANAATDNPAAYAISAAQEWITSTIVVRPAPVVQKTVVITGVTTGEHTVLIGADTVNFYISVDASVPAGAETIALGGVSVPNTAFDWVWDVENTAPYLDYLTLDLVGVETMRYEPVDIISGTTLLDETGAFDATITWGSNDSNVTINLGSLMPPAVVQEGADTTTPDVAGVINDPTDMYTDATGTVTGSWIDDIVTIFSGVSTGTPVWMVWVFLAFAMPIIAYAYVYKLLHHTFFAGLAAMVATGVFIAWGVVPFWFIIYGLLAVVGGVIAERASV